jgi:hypothetical protein
LHGACHKVTVPQCVIRVGIRTVFTIGPRWIVIVEIDAW